MKPSLAQKIKAKIYSLQEAMGLRYYTRTQRYHVQHITRVKNVRAISNDVSLIIPLPNNYFYQKVTSDLDCSIEPSQYNIDKINENYYGIWNIGLRPDETKEISLQYDVLIGPREMEIENELTLDDYEIDDEYKLYTRSSDSVQLNSAKLAVVSQNIAIGVNKISEIINAINEYVIDGLRYGNKIRGLHSSEFALMNGCVDCGGFDTLFIAFCRIKGIPARLVSGFWAGKTDGSANVAGDSMHAWVEIMLPDKTWIGADPASEHLRRQSRIKRSGRLGFLGSDRIALSVDCDFKIQVFDTVFEVPILQHAFLANQTQAHDIIMSTEYRTKKK